MIFQIIFAAIIASILFLFIFYLFWKLYFLRNPAVIIPEGNSIVSPAFGKVTKIIPFTKKEITHKKGIFGNIHTFLSDVAAEGTLIVIQLTPFDVHYQRSPVNGIVRKITYSEGKFDNAVLSKFAFENEKNEILIEYSTQKKRTEKLKVIQIAGILARRIECFTHIGHPLKKGELIGLINLGSQVALILPKKKIFIKEGDIVRGGETVIAKV